MDMIGWEVIFGVVLVAVLVFALVSRLGEGRDLSAPPSGLAPPPPRPAAATAALAPAAETPGGIPQALADELARELAAGNKIVAIKRLREETGWDLLRCKEFVEAMAR